MTDRELLEAAAKAAGDAPSGISYTALLGLRQWNPLGDDGDALRLAVKLGIVMYGQATACGERFAEASPYSMDCDDFPWIPHGTDAFAAMRRAIVTAAAAMVTG